MILVQLTPANAPIVGEGRPLFPIRIIKDKKLVKDIKKQGLEAMRELTLYEMTGAGAGSRNPQKILQRFKTEAMKLARAREMELVPKLLAEIRDCEKALRRTKDDLQSPEAERVKEAGALTKQIRQLKQRRYKQQQENSRAAHRLYGDRPTRYWSKIHKDCAPRDIICAFEKEGQLGTAGEKLYETYSVRMAEMARTHHMNVQRDDTSTKSNEARECDITAALNNLEAKVTELQAEQLGDKITYEDVTLSLRFAKNGSSPGLDGVPFEFWKTLQARFAEDARHQEREALRRHKAQWSGPDNYFSAWLDSADL